MRIRMIQLVVTNEADELSRMIEQLMLIKVMPKDLIELPEVPTIETKIGPTFDDITNGILDGYPRREVQPW